MAQTVLILGGGVGGVVAANVLGKILPKKHEIILVDRNANHSMRSSYPLLLVNRRRPTQISRKLAGLQRRGIRFIQAEVDQLEPGRRRVKTGKGPVDYDYLLIALGAEHHPETVPGLAEGAYNPWSLEEAGLLGKRLSSFRRGRIVLFISSLPYTGVIGPYETVFLLDDYFRRRGLRKQVELTMVTPEPFLFPLAGPPVAERVRRSMEHRGIEVVAQARVLFLDPQEKQLVLDHGITIPGDLFIGIPSHWGPSALRDSGLAEEGGWITVDPHTLETGTDRVFAVGDAAAIRLPLTGEWAPRAGIFAHYQAEVVSRNIAAMIAGKKPRFRYGGMAGAVMLTALNRGQYLSVHYYKKPRPRFALYRPTIPGYWAKIAFEKYWLRRWL